MRDRLRALLQRLARRSIGNGHGLHAYDARLDDLEHAQRDIAARLKLLEYEARLRAERPERG